MDQSYNESPNLQELDEDELIKCNNPENPETWYYELVDDEIRRYHSSHGFEGDSVPTRDEAKSSINQDVVDTKIVKRSDLK